MRGLIMFLLSIAFLIFLWILTPDRENKQTELVIFTICAVGLSVYLAIAVGNKK